MISELTDMYTYLNNMRSQGYSTQKIGTWTKLCHFRLVDIEVTVTTYRISNETSDMYVGEDDLEKLFFDNEENYGTVISWLEKHGYKPVADPFIDELKAEAEAYWAMVSEE